MNKDEADIRAELEEEFEKTNPVKTHKSETYEIGTIKQSIIGNEVPMEMVLKAYQKFTKEYPHACNIYLSSTEVENIYNGEWSIEWSFDYDVLLSEEEYRVHLQERNERKRKFVDCRIASKMQRIEEELKNEAKERELLKYLQEKYGATNVD